MLSWLRSFFPKKNYSLTIRTLDDSYCDQCELLLQAPFEILTRFIEEDNEMALIDWDGETFNKETAEQWELDLFIESSRIHKEAQILYEWWIEREPKRNAVWDALPDCETFREKDSPFYGEHGLLIDKGDPDCTQEIEEYWDQLREVPEDEWQREDDEMLLRLMAIRNALWI